MRACEEGTGDTTAAAGTDMQQARNDTRVLKGYHFDRHIKAFTLGDGDTPSVRLYETDGRTSRASCGRPARAEARRNGRPSSIWI
jgi:hypothetical protein